LAAGVSGLVGSAAGGASIRTANGAKAGAFIATINKVGPDTTGDVVETLASLFAFGLVAPATDNVFEGPTCDAVWRLGDASNDYAGIAGLYEHQAEFNPSRAGVPAWQLKRYYPASAGIGASVFDARIVFDPAWGGNVASFNDFTFESPTMFASDPAEDFTATTGVASDDIGIFAGYTGGQFQQPFAYNSGTMAHADTSLFNSLDGYARRVQRLTGWGQTFAELVPTVRGVVPQWVTSMRGDGRNPLQAGDGTGWSIGIGGLGDPSGAPVQGLFSFAVDVAGIPYETYDRFGWHFWTNKAADNSLTQVAGLNELGVSFGGGAPLASLDVAAIGAQVLSLGATGPAGVTSLTPSAWGAIILAGQKFVFPLFPST
jgi:hypothetical protein